MNITELSAFRTAANKAAADLETAKDRLAVARHEVDLLTEVRANLPFDEKKIAAHIDKEKAADLKCEIAERLFAAAESALALAKANLVSAEWQSQHDDLAARAEEFIKILKTDYVVHATALAKIITDFQAFHGEASRFRARWVMAGSEGKFSVQSPADVLGLRGLLEMKIPSLYHTQLFPTDRPRPPQLVAVEDSLDTAIG